MSALDSGLTFIAGAAAGACAGLTSAHFRLRQAMGSSQRSSATPVEDCLDDATIDEVAEQWCEATGHAGATGLVSSKMRLARDLRARSERRHRS